MSTSYAALAAQVAGLLIAGLVLRSLLRRRVSFALAATLAATALLVLLAAPGVWGALRGLDGVRASLELAPGITEREKCLLDGGRPEAIGLSRWLRQRIPPEEDFSVSGRLPYVCLQLTVLPRRMVQPDEPHAYTLYVDKIPAAIRAQARAQRGLAPGSRSAEAYDDYTDDVVLVREG